MVATTTMRLIVFVSVATLINADPDPDPGLMRVNQVIVHRKPPFDPCRVNSDCTEPHQTCVDYYCKCKDGFTHTNGKCVGGLGGHCTSEADCIVPHSVCEEGTCECEFGYVSDGSYCYERRAYGEKCKSDSQCVGSEYSCNDGHCGCSEHAVYLVGLGCQPVRLIGGECVHDKQCDAGTTNSECDTNCQCETDFRLNDEEDACVPAYCTVTLEIASEQPWDANWANTASAEYAANRVFWKDILNDAGITDDHIDLDSMVFTLEGEGGTKITVDVTVEHTFERKRRAFGISRNRLDLGELLSGEGKEESLAAEIAEGMKRDDYKHTLTGLLMKREINELENPITISIPSLSDDNFQLDGFCLQNKDCVGNFAMCSENICN